MKLKYLSLAHVDPAIYSYWEVALGCKLSIVECVLFHSPLFLDFVHRAVVLHAIVPRIDSILYKMHAPFTYPNSVYKSGGPKETALRFWDQTRFQDCDVSLYWQKQLGKLTIKALTKNPVPPGPIKYTLQLVQHPHETDFSRSSMALELQKTDINNVPVVLLYEPLHFIRYPEQIHRALRQFMDLMPEYWLMKGPFPSELNV